LQLLVLRRLRPEIDKAEGTWYKSPFPAREAGETLGSPGKNRQGKEMR